MPKEPDDMPNVRILREAVREEIDGLFSPASLVLAAALVVILGLCLLAGRLPS